MIQAPFLWLALSFAAGVILRAGYNSVWIWPLLSAVSISLFFLRNQKYFYPALYAGLMLFGMICADLDHHPAPSVLRSKIEKQGTESFFAIKGKVVTEPEAKIYGRKQTVSFIFEVSRVMRWEKSRPVLRQKAKGRIQVFLNQPGALPQSGDSLRLWGRFEELPPVLNPGGFDYREYLRARDVDYIFNAYGAKSVKLLKPARLSNPARFLSAVRQSIRSRSDALFSLKESLLIRALILGDRKNLRGPVLDDFLKTGTTHLLAISGLNISMVAGSFYLILIVLRAGQKKAAFLALLLAVFQTAVGGFGIPVQRAGIMACLGFLALMAERERSSINLFSFAFFVLLLLDTRNLESISFQLSFLSLFCLILFTRLWNPKWHWAEAWASSAAVLAGTFPAVLYHFSTFSPIGIAANVLAIPLFHFVLLTGCLALLFGSIPVFGLFLKMTCGFFLKLGLEWIHFCASADWGYFFLPKPSWGIMLFYYGCLAALTASWFIPSPKRRILRGMALAGWIAATVLFFVPKPRDGFSAVFFSAGSNEIAHLAFGPGNHWLVNSGRTFPGDQAQWILHPYLRGEGIKSLKGILFSDDRKRHTAGYETLKRSFLFQYQASPAEEKGTQKSSSKRFFLHGGDSVEMPEGGRVAILSHAKSKLLFRVEAEGRSFLFLPDLSVDVFEKLKQSKGRRTDILVLPSMRDGGSTMLKSFLTVTEAKAVIAPRIDSGLREILAERDLDWMDLSAQGALSVQIRKENGKPGKIEMARFLFPDRKVFL